MGDEFESIVTEAFGETFPSFSKNVKVPLVKIRSRMIRAYNRFDCGENKQETTKSGATSQGICSELIQMVDDVLSWNNNNFVECKTKATLATKRSISYGKKLNGVKNRLEKRCENKLKRL